MSTCVLCARRGVVTELATGHCCPRCHERIDRDLAGIVTNADLAAVGTVAHGNGGTRGSFESKPPIDLDSVAPYAVLVKLDDGEHYALWAVLESWERLLREERGLASYGDATAGHTGTEVALQAQAARASVSVLRAHLAWITVEPTWPIEQFAKQVRQCAARVRALVEAREEIHVAKCPTLADDGRTCDVPLKVEIWSPTESDKRIGADIECPRCHVIRSPEQLLAVATDETYVDAEAIAQWFGIGESTIRRWAKDGKVRRERGLYSWTDVRALVIELRQSGYRKLAKAVRA